MMKSLKEYLDDYLQENGTPANTMGMGNPMPPTEDQPGSEPLATTKHKKKKKCEKCGKEIEAECEECNHCKK